MKVPAFSRPTSNLSASIYQQLNAYRLAATAAGVGLLSLTQPAEAKIVYTPANVRITGAYKLDLNHEITDFTLLLHQGHSTTFRTSALWIYNTNQHINSKNGEPEALKAGFLIGWWAKSKFDSHGLLMAQGGWDGSKAFYRGLWANGGEGVGNRYLGLKFTIEGEVHFGWARLNVSFPRHSVRAVLTGHAYETIPKKAIPAGKTKGSDETSSVGGTESHCTCACSATGHFGPAGNGRARSLHLAAEGMGAGKSINCRENWAAVVR